MGECCAISDSLNFESEEISYHPRRFYAHSPSKSNRTMKKNAARFALYLLFALSSFHLFSQDSRFHAGVVAGLNFSELEGDGVTDYFGLNTGLIGTARLTKHAQLGVELLYSQNGEYIIPEFYPPLEYGPVRLNHLEIPIHIDWLIGVFQRESYYDLNLSIGTAYTRLLSYRVKDAEKKDVSDQVVYGDRDAWHLQAATSYQLSKRLGLNLKASLPISVNGLDWTLAARLVYMFS